MFASTEYFYFPLLVSKESYHWWKHISIFVQGTEANGRLQFANFMILMIVFPCRLLFSFPELAPFFALFVFLGSLCFPLTRPKRKLLLGF